MPLLFPLRYLQMFSAPETTKLGHSHIFLLAFVMGIFPPSGPRLYSMEDMLFETLMNQSRDECAPLPYLST